MEKLGQLRHQQIWDLIVVDTPPSRSALDFLDAPKRMGSFLDGRLIRLLAAPARSAGKMGARMVGASLSLFTGAMTKVLGAQVLRDLQLFVSSFDALFGGFRERADQTYAQLQAPDTRFLVVAAPESDALREASYFVQRLETERMPLAGLVLNRVQDVRLPELSAATARAGAERVGGEHRLVAELLRMHADRMETASRQAHLMRSFTGAHPRVPVTQVIALADDVHDLEGLTLVGDMMAR